MNGKRTKRISHQIRDEISLLLQRGELKDPRIGFVTIPHVRISKDLRQAIVFASVFGTKKEETDSLQALKKAQGFIRRKLSKRLHVRHIPELRFELDHSIEKGVRMCQVIRALPTFDDNPSFEEDTDAQLLKSEHTDSPFDNFTIGNPSTNTSSEIKTSE